MRTNLPVTQKEVVLDDDAIIVSKTDLNGCITYVNDAFVAVSGFTEQELIGESHNIVRHPDVPPAAFKDLWTDLKAGRPWVGCIKNRCKNGDFYWVEAHVSPFVENNRVSGYMSLRRKASQNKIAKAERLFRDLLEERTKGITMRHGQISGSGLFARIRQSLSDASLGLKLMLAGGSVALLILAVSTALLNNNVATVLSDSGQADLSRDVGLVKSMVELKVDDLKRDVNRLNATFLGMFPEAMTLSGDSGTPTLLNGSHVLNNRFDEVDRFTATTGAVATIFARNGDDFLRISTSLKKENGERALGTLLDKTHPAFQSLSAGKPYTGIAHLFGKDYFASYAPIFDASGHIIGANFIGLDITNELMSLKSAIKSVKVGNTGYFYILDANPGADMGKLVLHPAKEGSNILGAKDAAGHEFIKEIIERKQGTIYYPWMNAELGDTIPRQKIVIFDHLPDVGWVVAGGTYLDEFNNLASRIRWMVAIGGMLMVVLMGLSIYLMIRRLILAPIDKSILPTFNALATGNFDSSLSVALNDEIGRVFQGLEKMRIELKVRLDAEHKSAAQNHAARVALDNFDSSVRISGLDGTITYHNKKYLELSQALSADLKKQYPEHAFDNPIGLRTPTLREHMGQPHLQGRVTCNIATIGKEVLSATEDPVLDENGKAVSYVLVMKSVRDERKSESMIAEVLDGIRAGDLSKRVATEELDGFYKVAGDGMNSVCDIVQHTLDDLARVLHALSSGDLTEKISAEYQGTFAQIKNDTNQTVEKLTEIISQIKEATDTIGTASAEIASGNSDLSSRTEQQAASLEETASSMEELTSTVKLNAENAQQANQLAKGASDVAVKGGNVVGQVVHTMGEINESSKKIADIIGVIDGIAFQTNILALNAAVEAARAGEQGRGFAVVATEVRNLAQRSAAAAKEIKVLIDDSVSKVGNGTKLVDEAGRTMEEVVTSIKRVTDIMAEISAASNEQSQGIAQVSSAVEQMDDVTQQNAALVEQAAAAAESMEEQARNLAQSVSVFKLVEGGRQAPARSSSPKVSHMAAKRQPGKPAKPQAKRAVAGGGAGAEAEGWEEF